MSKAILIFDENVSVEALERKLRTYKLETIFLFALTSNCALIHRIESLCQSILGVEIKVMESADLIDREVDELRHRVSKWSAELGNCVVDGRTIREWFSLPDVGVTTWWFSIVSEKNTLTTHVFFRIAQVQAIYKLFSSNNYDLCIYSVHEKELSEAIEKLAERCCKENLRVPCIISNFRDKEVIKSFLERSTVGCILKALVVLGIGVSRAFRAKITMGSVRKRMREFNDAVLFFSYFPAVDLEAAKEGVLKNKFGAPLQKKLAEMDKRIIWFMMYVPIDGHTYSNALALGKTFLKNGETFFFLEEFITFKILLKVFYLWLLQVRNFLILDKQLPTRSLCEGLSIDETEVFLRKLMLESFVGSAGLKVILHFEVFKEIFSYFNRPYQCIYYAEMLGWEKALNAAKRLKAPTIRTIGFQHAQLPRNLFPYYHHASELLEADSPLGVPLPDILACNGDIPLEKMRLCGYPNLRKVEAIRHLYLIKALNSELNVTHKERVVLIAGSINQQETKALVSLFYDAFPQPKGFKVWLKGHPSLPINLVTEELGIDTRKAGYQIRDCNIGELLRVSKIVLVGGSSVSLEALAMGCTVIVPVICDSMFMSPLGGYEKYYEQVTTSAQLKAIVEKSIESQDAMQVLERKKFIFRYFCLDNSLKRWEDLLK